MDWRAFKTVLLLENAPGFEVGWTLIQNVNSSVLSGRYVMIWSVYVISILLLFINVIVFVMKGWKINESLEKTHLKMIEQKLSMPPKYYYVFVTLGTLSLWTSMHFEFGGFVFQGSDLLYNDLRIEAFRTVTRVVVFWLFCVVLFRAFKLMFLMKTHMKKSKTNEEKESAS
ncbi:MAG: hypothetical protein ING19_18135 [Azospirillum sp.]|nr:hypothetical protein [Azospirillum sp.]